MIHNSHGHHPDDALTVQVSDANSNLGNLLLEADWEEALDYLATPEGQHDVDSRNDPLGLFNSRSSTKIKHGEIPVSKNTAFFAALFVRAPYKVIEKIYSMEPTHVDEPEDLMYVLAVITSEEQARLSSGENKKIPYRTRAWSPEEYNQILHLLLQSFLSSKSDSSLLMNYWPSWVIVTSNVTMTPLAIAAYNGDVEAKIVQLLCTLEPRAMGKECTFFRGVQATPLIIAAASPLPPKLSAEYGNAKERRWEKVKLLTFSQMWYDEQREMLSKTVDESKSQLAVSSLPEPTMQQVQHACEEAVCRDEWELTREFLKRYHDSSVLDQIQTVLEEHDEKANATLQRQQKAKDQASAREEWMHNNMGLIMYPVNVVMDLVSAVIPAPKKDQDVGRGIVPPMS